MIRSLLNSKLRRERQDRGMQAAHQGARLRVDTPALRPVHAAIPERAQRLIPGARAETDRQH